MPVPSKEQPLTASAADPEAQYYQSIEEFFVSRRGDPLMISNADWFTASKWRRAGIPLRIVLRGIGDALDSHAHSWSRNRKVESLAYCSAEVEAAHERWQRALQLGAEEGLSPASRLAELAASLEEARTLGPRARPRAQALAKELAARDGERPREVEPWLAAQEKALVAAIGEDLGPAGLAAVSAVVDAALAPYAGRMPARVLEQVRQESLARRLLEAQGLPRLSLFELS
jgi:hypothetical protein